MKKEFLSDIIYRNYGFQPESITELVSDVDQNNLIKTSDDQKYIFKIHEAQYRNRIITQNSLLRYLSALSFNVPKILPTLSITDTIELDHQGKKYICRLLSYIDGEFLSRINILHISVLRNFGKFLGNLDKHMNDFNEMTDLRDDFIWNLKNFTKALSLLKFVTEVEKKRLIKYFLLQFEMQLNRYGQELRQSLIHNDANPWNVLVEENEIKGIIDFGDMVINPTVFNPSIALSYLLFESCNLLQTASDFLKAYHEVFPLRENEFEIIYYTIAARLCISLCVSSKKAVQNPNDNYGQVDHENAWSLLQKWIRINPVLFENHVRGACGFSPQEKLDDFRMMEERFSFLSASLSTSYKQPIHMVKAAMQYMYDQSGNTYLDCVNNICHVGHCHPHVVKAAQYQVATLNTNTRYLFKEIHDYAERLLDKFPDPLSKIFFVNSGSAATDLAYRLARNHTGTDDVIVLEGAYHGNLISAIDLSPYKFNGPGGSGRKAYVHTVSMPDLYRGPYLGENVVTQYCEEVISILSRQPVGAFLSESILGCGGQIPLPDGYLKAIYSVIRQNNGICIADEVQVGFGRLGKSFWGFELYDVIPDIVILGKPMGNGHPIAAVVTTTEICRSFENGMEFFSSFGGNPVSCAIGNAVLDVLENEGLQEHALNMGNIIMEQWNQIKAQFECIGDVRGLGLFLGIEIVKSKMTKDPDADKAQQIVEELKQRKILLSTDGPDHNVIKFKPPMVFDEGDAQWVNRSLNAVLRHV